MNLMAMVLIWYIVGVRTQSPFTVRKLNNTGIIFEEVSTTLLYTNRWTIFSTISLRRISVWKDYMDWSEHIIEQMCGQSPVANLNQTCAEDIQNVRYITDRIRIMLKTLEVHGTRYRRGVFDGIGSLSKFLFGTMDNADAEKIYSRLQALETDDKQNLELIKEQVSLIKSNYETNNKVLEEFSLNLDTFKVYVSDIITAFNSTLNTVILETNSLINRITLNEAATNIIIHLEEIEHQINSLYIILNSLSNGHLHPLILSYQQISSTITNLHNSQPLHESIQNPFLVQQIATVESVQAYETIFCKITVPLVRREWFSLKKVYPLPIPKDGITAHYEILHDYLVTDDGASIFIPLHDNELKTCTKVSLKITSQTLVCQFTVPIYTSAEDHCLLLLYKGWPEANQVCNTVPMLQEHNTIIKMVTENSWLYIFPAEMTVNIECSEFKTVLKLEGRGILNLKPNCKATIGNILLTTINTVVRNITIQQTELIPKIDRKFQMKNIPTLNTGNSIKKLQFMNHEKQSQFLQDNKNKLENFLSKIDKIQNDREERTRIHAHSTHIISLAVLGCLAVLSIIISLIVIIRQRRYRATIPQQKTQNSRTFKGNIPRQPRTSLVHEIETRMEENPKTLSISEPNLGPKFKGPSIPITTPTVKVVLPEDRNLKVNVSDFEIV